MSRFTCSAPWAAVSPHGNVTLLHSKEEVNAFASRDDVHLPNKSNFRQLLSVEEFVQDKQVYDHLVVHGWRCLDKLQFFVNKDTGQWVPVIGELDAFYRSRTPSTRC